MEISAEIVVIGLFTGLAYGVMGAGLVLVYRATRVINFAHGSIGAFAGAVLAKLVLDNGWNWFLAFGLAAVIGAALGAFWELTVIRRLFDSPRLVLFVATIGIAEVMFAVQNLVPTPFRPARFPTGIDRAAEIGSVTLRGEHFVMIALVPALIVGLTLFLNATPYGQAIRAAADDADGARLAGVSVQRVSTMVWAAAGLLSAATYISIAPVRGVLATQNAATAALGPGLLVRALAAAMIGNLRSFPMTIVGGVVVGVAEALIILNVGDPGLISFLLLIVIVAVVWWQGREDSGGESASFSLTPKIKAVPAHLRNLPSVRRLPAVALTAAFVVAVAIPFVFTEPSRQFMFASMLVMAVIGLSVVVLTGWAGQLSLGQFALAGVGAMVTASLVSRGIPLVPAMAYAVVAGVVVSLVLGAPALRISGLNLAVITLSFALAAPEFILTRDFLLTGSEIAVTLPRSTLGPFDLSSQRSYYFLCLAVLCVTLLAVEHLRRTGVGRRIVAVRDNEITAAAFTVSPTVAKLSAFALSGGIAALGGALYAGLNVSFPTDRFVVDGSLQVVSMTIIGGLGSVYGALLGALYVVGLPSLFEGVPQVSVLTSGIGLLVLLLYVPGGLTSGLYKLRDVVVARADRRLRAEGLTDRDTGHAPRTGGPRHGTVVRAGDAAAALPEVVLDVDSVTVRFDGLLAVDRVSIEAHRGETVGLIGANGAGKSTLMNVISGNQRATEGHVTVAGDDVTALPSHRRAAMGVARLHQDARLFGSLTVRESVMVALESQEQSELVPSLLALPPSRRGERTKRAEADELVDYLGLGRYADRFTSELSTGTRRIAELACVVAMRPVLLLLDEPTAGIAQREAEAFGPLIERIRRELGATLVIIEHDMPLVMSLSDRIYCMTTGRVIAEGTPDAVRQDPAVIAAYLGTDDRAIARSDSASPAQADVEPVLEGVR